MICINISLNFGIFLIFIGKCYDFFKNRRSRHFPISYIAKEDKAEKYAVKGLSVDFFAVPYIIND